YDVEGIILEKRILLLHLQNTVHVGYTLLSQKDGIRLELRPSMHFRPHESSVSEGLEQPYLLSIMGQRCEISSKADHPPLRMLLQGENSTFVLDRGMTREVFYRIEAERGYASRGTLWSPGYVSVTLVPGVNATLIASSEPWTTILALKPEEALQDRKSVV